MINMGDVVRYHTKHPKSIGKNWDVFHYHFSYLLKNLLCNVLPGFSEEDISYEELKSSFLSVFPGHYQNLYSWSTVNYFKADNI